MSDCTIDACDLCDENGRFCPCWPEKCARPCETCEHDCPFHRCGRCGSRERDDRRLLAGLEDDEPEECDGRFHEVMS